MPEKKKPASRSSASKRTRSSASKTTRSRSAAPARRAAGKTTRRSAAKPAARRRTTKPKPAEAAPERDDLDLVESESSSGATPFVVGTPGSMQADDRAAGDAGQGEVAILGEGAPEAPSEAEEPSEPDRYPEDIPIAIVSAILAASPFLPWYKIKGTTGTDITASGWETGTWGPMVLFLGVLSLGVAILRRVKIKVGLPVHDSHLHEGIGWLAIIGAVIKLRAAPKGAGNLAALQMSWTWGVIVAIVAAFLLAFLAGRMSGSAPFVRIPGWFRGKAGAIGLALLAIAIGGAAAFGTINNIDVGERATGQPTAPRPGGSGNSPAVIQNAFPKCAEGFPRPADADPQQAVEQTDQSPCVFTFKSKQTAAQLAAFYKSELPKAGYTFEEAPARDEQSIAFTIRKPQCGNVAIQRASGASESDVIVAIGGQCPPETPSGRGSPSPSPTS